jgi:hypothetical protein
MQFDSRRATCPGYLEFIWRADVPREPGTNPQAIAYITDAYSTPRKPWFCGVYGIHVVEGPSVATVKTELFSLIEEQ